MKVSHIYIAKLVSCSALLETWPAVAVIALLSMFASTASARADLMTHYQFNDAASEATLAFNSVTGVNDPLAGSGVLTQVAGPGGSVPSGASFGTTSVHRRINVGGGPLVGNGGVSAALRFRTTDALSSIRSLVFGGDSTGADDLFILELQQGKPRIFIREAGSINSFALLHDTSLADDQWHCMAFTWSGGSVDHLSLYVDGLLSQQQSIPRGFFSTTSWSVGSRYANGTTNFSYGGALADVRIYDRALSEAEIASLCGPTNASPVAACQDVTVPTDEGLCSAGASIDAGSSDPDGDPITLVQDPPGPYGLGSTLVTLTVTDEPGESDSCQATVTVEDRAAPVITCNAPATITPPDAPIDFTASAGDNCSVASVEVTGYDCWMTNGAGKRVDKTSSCVVSFAGDTVTVEDSGGVGDHVEWTVTATDGSGNPLTMTCSTDVVNPGNGKGKGKKD